MKKFSAVLLAALIITGTSFTTANADMPPGTVVVGEKAFDLNYLMNPTAEESKYILNYIIQGKEIYVKTFAGKWVKNSDNSELANPDKVLPEVVYKNIDGKEVTYAKGDGDVVEAEDFYVVDIY